jgi:hypothetical protein
VRIVQALPPLIDEIDAAFNVRGRPILFAWGDKIFNPAGGAVPPELLAHEAVHGERQGADVAGWWRRYIAEPQFRLDEELPAHAAEFKVLCEILRPKWQSERNMRRTIAGQVARKMTAPLYRYGSLINVDTAKKALLAA